MFFRQADKQIVERIREEIRARLDPLNIPEQVEAFLLDNWSLLLKDIYLSRGGEHPDWQAGWDTVDALIWSLTPKQSREETERLLRLLPILLGRLQEGCAALAMPAQEAEALFKLLAGWHAALARAGLKPNVMSGLEPADNTATDMPASVQHVPAAGGVGHEDAEASEEAAEPPSLLDSLQPGVWVTIRCVGGDKELCLQWISASGNMYLFADGQGLDALSLTRQRLQDRVARGELSLRV